MAKETPEEFDPIEPLLEASLADNRQGHENTHRLLEAVLEQADNNDVTPLLEASLVLGQKNTDRVVEAINSIPKTELPEPVKIPEFPKKIDVEITNKNGMELAGAFFSLLKGEKGDSRSEEELIEIIKPLIPPIPSVINGKDGKDGLSITGPMGPTGPAGKDGSPDSPDDIVKKLGKINRPWLDKSKIIGLKQIEDSLTRLASSVSAQGTEFLMGGLHRVYTDGVTITGDGTPENPLVGAGGNFVPYTGANADVDLGAHSLSVADEAYGVGWNGSLEVPTKNALYDKIQTIASGGITRTITSISSNATAGAVAAVDYVYFVTGTTTLTLPTAVGNTNRYTIKSISGTTVVAADGAETIDGASTIGIANEDSVDLISNNTEWKVV